MGIKFQSKAPTRIDLAGGTIDLWPLYLFLKEPITLNLGIDLFAETTLSVSESSSESSSASGVTLESIDQNLKTQFPWSQLETLSGLPPGLELHHRLLRHFVLKRLGSVKNLPALTLSTRAQSPAGAGLGGSSTLSISMIGALANWAASLKNESPLDTARDGEAFIEVVRDIETTVIRVPAGMQDYYAAMYGGLQSLEWGVGTHRHRALPTPLIRELEKRLVLFYSGQSRNSGINNWALFKAFIDGDASVREKFEKISSIAKALREAISAQDWVGASKAIAEEWSVRRSLAPGISNPAIDAALAEAQSFGSASSPVGGKICGAGGGGCFFVFLPETDPTALATLREKTTSAFVSKGMKRLEFKAVDHGLDIQVSHA